MKFVQCEAPDCLMQIPREKAATFEDKDFFIHFACDSHCLVEAMIEYSRRNKETKVFVEALEG